MIDNKKLDGQERMILRELIKNPRISDNQISKNTQVPLMTVNRKRKALEESGIVHYYTGLVRSQKGMGIFSARQLYVIKFRLGMTQAEYMKEFNTDLAEQQITTKYVMQSFLGEKDGHLALMLIIEAQSESDLIEIFNTHVVQELQKRYGPKAIDEIFTARITMPLRLHHNYLPTINMERGRIKKSWADNLIFVDEL